MGLTTGTGQEPQHHTTVGKEEDGDYCLVMQMPGSADSLAS